MVVGGGPAGISVARTAAEAGLRVVLVDERPSLGGQIYKQPGPGFVVCDPAGMDGQYRAGRSLIDSLEGVDVEVLLRTSVLSVEDGRVVLLTDGEHARTVEVQKLVLATGAHDRPVVFPGWTLPGVMTAGALQTMAKTQRVLPRGRILFAGSGPVALAFPAQLSGYGAEIVTALEAGPAPSPVDLFRLLRAAKGNTALLREAWAYRTALLRARIPVRYRRIVVSAAGEGRVEQVTHAAVDAQWRVVPGTDETVAVEALCLGYGFIPSLELLRLVGCEFDFDENLGGHVVRRDEWLRTTVPDVYAAGDGAGVEGSSVAVKEGQLAGMAVAMDLGAMSPAAVAVAATPIRAQLRRKRALSAATSRLFQVGPGIFDLSTPDTVVCRCEGVRHTAIAQAIGMTDDINVVKARTRAGMGLCQGKNCQRHIAAMIGRHHGCPVADVSLSSPRTPVRPVPISALADHSITGRTLFAREAAKTP